MAIAACTGLEIRAKERSRPPLDACADGARSRRERTDGQDSKHAAQYCISHPRDSIGASTVYGLQSARQGAPIRAQPELQSFFSGRVSGLQMECVYNLERKTRGRPDPRRTSTQGRSPRSSQGGQILSFRNKIIFRFRGPDLDDLSRSKASPRCCSSMLNPTVSQTWTWSNGRRLRRLSAYPWAPGISRAG
jgi:hypothetical protein